jgi:hypothetical protein
MRRKSVGEKSAKSTLFALRRFFHSRRKSLWEGDNKSVFFDAFSTLFRRF